MRWLFQCCASTSSLSFNISNPCSETRVKVIVINERCVYQWERWAPSCAFSCDLFLPHMRELNSRSHGRWWVPVSFCYACKSPHILAVNSVCYLFFSQIPLLIRDRSRRPLTSATRLKSAASWTSTLQMPPWTKVRTTTAYVSVPPGKTSY